MPSSRSLIVNDKTRKLVVVCSDGCETNTYSTKMLPHTTTIQTIPINMLTSISGNNKLLGFSSSGMGNVGSTRVAREVSIIIATEIGENTEYCVEIQRENSAK